MNRVAWLLYIIGSVVFLGLWFGPSYGRYARLKRQLCDLRSDIKRLARQREDLMQKIKQIEKDPGMVEEIARRKYKMGRPDEIVYVISPGENRSQK